MPRVPRPPTLLAAALAVVLLAGCGNDKSSAEDVGSIPAPNGFRDAIYRQDGIRFRAPENWRLVPGSSPQVVTVAAGEGQIGVWRFKRKEPLPRTIMQLDAARQALVKQIEKRDPTFHLVSSRIIVKPRLKGVEVVGEGTNQGQRRYSRSVHAYANGAEIVLDGFAPVNDFARVDKQVLARVARSLKVSKPKKA